MAIRNPMKTGSDYLYDFAVYLTVAFIVAVTIAPFIYAFSVSFRPVNEFFGEVHLIPYEPTLRGWKLAFREITGPLINSAKIATGTAIIAMLITVPGAYVFGRQEFPGKETAFYLIIVALMFPYILLIIPITDLWDQLGLYNTVPGLWLAYQVFVTPFTIWILRDFFEKMPANLEEAAQIYGCTQFQAFRKVILPLAVPALVSTGFLAFLVGWNDFLFSNMLTTGSGPRPAVVTLFITTTGGERSYWAIMMAEVIIIGTPPTLLYMVARRQLTSAFSTA